MLIFALRFFEEPLSMKKFMRIYHNYYKLINAVSYGILGNKHDSEDAVQETLIKILRHIDTVEDLSEERLKGLCIVISRNTALDILRKHRRETEPEYLSENLSKSESFESAVAEEIDVNNAVRTLSDRERDIIYLRYSLDLSYSDISALMNLSEGNVRTILSRAKAKIRMELNDYENL